MLVDREPKSALEVGDLYPNLLGSVAIADRNGTILESIEVDDNALRSADFVLFPVTLADIAGVVPGDVDVFLLQNIVDFVGLRD